MVARRVSWLRLMNRAATSARRLGTKSESENRESGNKLEPLSREKRVGVRRHKVYGSNPLTPTLSPPGGERELFPFGAGVRMHP